MRSSYATARASIASLFLLVVAVPACGEDVAQPDNSELGQRQQALCPDPDAFCSLSHPGSAVTGVCAYDACFEMSDGAEIRLMASDEQGDFPTAWHAWTRGRMERAGGSPCLLTTHGRSNRLEIPEGSIKCRADLTVDGHVYHEHFVSNPATACLGWVECAEP